MVRCPACVALVVLLAVVLLLLAAPAGAQDDAGEAHRAVGLKAPIFRLTDTAGEDVVADDYRNRRYAMAFISTTCPACRRTSARLLERLAADEDLTVIAVVIDADRSPAGGPSPAVAARAFKRNEIGQGGARDRFIVCPATSAVREAWGEKVATPRGPVVAVPTIVAVSVDGNVRAVLEGEADAATLADVLPAGN